MMKTLNEAAAELRNLAQALADGEADADDQVAIAARLVAIAERLAR